MRAALFDTKFEICQRINPACRGPQGPCPKKERPWHVRNKDVTDMSHPLAVSKLAHITTTKE